MPSRNIFRFAFWNYTFAIVFSVTDNRNKSNVKVTSNKSGSKIPRPYGRGIFVRLRRILPSTGLPPLYYEGIINRLQTVNLRILSSFQQKSQSHQSQPYRCRPDRL